MEYFGNSRKTEEHFQIQQYKMITLWMTVNFSIYPSSESESSCHPLQTVLQLVRLASPESMLFLGKPLVFIEQSWDIQDWPFDSTWDNSTSQYTLQSSLAVWLRLSRPALQSNFSFHRCWFLATPYNLNSVSMYVSGMSKLSQGSRLLAAFDLWCSDLLKKNLFWYLVFLFSIVFNFS